MKPITKVTWHDAQDHKETWVSEEDTEQWSTTACVIVSVGFLVSKTSRYVILAADWNDDDKSYYGRVTKIPIEMIVESIELEKGGA